MSFNQYYESSTILVYMLMVQLICSCIEHASVEVPQLQWYYIIKFLQIEAYTMHDQVLHEVHYQILQSNMFIYNTCIGDSILYSRGTTGQYIFHHQCQLQLIFAIGIWRCYFIFYTLRQQVPYRCVRTYSVASVIARGGLRCYRYYRYSNLYLIQKCLMKVLVLFLYCVICYSISIGSLVVLSVS